MTLIPLFDPQTTGRPMRVAAFMSGSGTNVLRLLEREQKLKDQEGASPFEVVFLFSDRADGGCKGEKIALTYGLPYCSYDIRAFHRIKGIKRTALTPEGLSARKEFDQVAAKLMQTFQIDVVALGGYMSYITLKKCVNVHPADLSILTQQGKRKFTGDQAVRDAILAGEQVVCSSTLWTDEGVDTGPLLMISAPLQVRLPAPLETLRHDQEEFRQTVAAHQERLKEVGDWQIFPDTLEMIARGRFALDEQKQVHVDGKPVPHGYRYDERMKNKWKK